MIPAVVLAGGLGTRLRAVSADTPKPLVSVGGQPFIEHVLNMLVDADVPTICLAVSYRWESLRERLGNAYHGIPITYSVEREPLGTGGATLKCFRDNNFRAALVLNGDTLFKISLRELVAAHVAAGSLVTMALRSVDDVSRYGAVTCGADNRVLTFEEKGVVRPGMINGGVYVIERSAFDRADLPPKFSLETDFLQKHIGALQPVGLVSDAYFIDIGVPEDLVRAQREIQNAC